MSGKRRYREAVGHRIEVLEACACFLFLRCFLTGISRICEPHDDQRDNEDAGDRADELRQGEGHPLRHGTNDGDHDEPRQGNRDEALPAELHELVVAETQEGTSCPDHEDHEEPHLEEEPQHAEPAAIEELDVRQRPRSVPSAEEHGRCHR